MNRGSDYHEMAVYPCLYLTLAHTHTHTGRSRRTILEEGS